MAGVAALALAAVASLTGCASGVRAGPDPGPGPGSEGPALDPLGVYDMTMSSESLVSEGMMEIRGSPGNYRGRLVVGVTEVAIGSVEVGAGFMNVHADMPTGALVLRLAGDGAFFSGNWVLGAQRGTVIAEKRR